MPQYVQAEEFIDYIGETRASRLASRGLSIQSSDALRPRIDGALTRSSGIVDGYVTVPSPTPEIVRMWVMRLTIHDLGSGAGDHAALTEVDMENWKAVMRALERAQGGDIPWKVSSDEDATATPKYAAPRVFVGAPRRFGADVY